MTSARVFLEAARPRTLSAGVVPVIVGTAAAFKGTGTFHAARFALALVVAVAVQVGVNYANDWADGVAGVDTEARVGPRRAVAAGLVAPRTMLGATGAALAVAAVAGLALAALTSWWVVAVGAACFVAAIGYSAGPFPYASAGLGEVFVFVFFGLVATCGSAYVQLERVPAVAVAAAVPVGLLAVALILVNNLRDVHTDAAAGKRTLAVRLGEARTRTLFRRLFFVAFAWPVVFLVIGDTARPLVCLLALPLLTSVLAPVARKASGRKLVPVLIGTAKIQLVYGLLLAAALASA